MARVERLRSRLEQRRQDRAGKAEASATHPRVSHGRWRPRLENAERAGDAEPRWRRSLRGGADHSFGSSLKAPPQGETHFNSGRSPMTLPGGGHYLPNRLRFTVKPIVSGKRIELANRVIGGSWRRAWFNGRGDYRFVSAVARRV